MKRLNTYINVHITNTMREANGQKKIVGRNRGLTKRKVFHVHNFFLSFFFYFEKRSQLTRTTKNIQLRFQQYNERNISRGNDMCVV